MATTVLYDYTEKDSSILDAIENVQSINNFYYDLQTLLIDENLDEISFNEKFQYRPDIVAKQVYENEFFYPLILLANNIGSITFFDIANVGNTIKYIKPEIINYILSK